MKRSLLLVVALVLAGLGALHGQDVDTLVSNTNQTQVVVALDRTQYFPGEAAAVTLSVKNPTTGALSVFTPFTAATGCLNALTLSGGAVPLLLGSERLCTAPFDATTPTTILAAAEQRTTTLNSYDPMFDLGVGVLDSGGGVSRDSGYYSLEYNYSGSGARIVAFQVVVPHLDASAVARVPDIPYLDPTLNQTVPTEAYMHAFALRWANQTWICVTHEPGSIDQAAQPDSQGNFDGQMPPFVRVASSQNPVISLTLTSDAAGNLTLQWRDSTGAQQTMSLGTAPPAPTPRSTAVGIDPAWAGLGAAQSMQFNTATSSGSNSVNWSVALDSSAPNGAQTGTISSSGLYMAPSPINSAYSVVVTAASPADSSPMAISVVRLGSQETITTPTAPAGPAGGVAGSAYSYSTAGSVSSIGHPVQYSFDWGDGTNSGWLAQGTTTASHVWSAPGAYTVTVQARCAVDTSLHSDPSTTVVTIVVAQETISTPAVPAGPISGISGTLYQYTASGASSSLGHVIQYSFDWGDGSHSGWTPQGVTSSFHTWTAPGTYTVTVQARCTVDTTVVSSASTGLTVTIAGESVTAPTVPNGPTTAVTGTSVTFSTGGATSSLGHTVQYMIFWGDGSNSPWLPAGTTSASHSWLGSGTFTVTAIARCTVDTQVISPSSAAATVTVSAGETISTPTPPTGPASGAAGTAYSYSTGGSTSSLGNSVRYLFDWGDGTTSGWLAVGTTSASHQWTTTGTYTVTTFAASAVSLLVQSSQSVGLVVSIQ
jgi:hypothetical protein